MLCIVMILDTDVIIAAVRSTKGASAEIIRRVLRREIPIEMSVAIALEYEAVATRVEHLRAGEISTQEAGNLIDALIALATPIDINFRWRPQLRDADDEMVFEAAINALDPTIITFNRKDFKMAANKFDVTVLTPAAFLEGLK